MNHIKTEKRKFHQNKITDIERMNTDAPEPFGEKYLIWTRNRQR